MTIAKLSDPNCSCKEGMFPAAPLTRRGMILAAGTAAAGLAVPARAETPAAPAGAIEYPVDADPTKELGRPTGEDGGYGTRSQFETARRVLAPNPTRYTTWSFTPLAALLGDITPSGLHYERHHAGIPTIDPAHHSLAVHGLVDKPMLFSMADLYKLPAVSRRHFIECSGNTLSEWKGPQARTVQSSHGLLSTSEWTGVRFSDVAALVGIKPQAKWVIAEGADGAVLTRSIPIDKMLDDAMLAYGQNGEAIRPEQGYPLRLLLPGWEGNTHIKWLQSLQVADEPAMSREETSKYTDLMPSGKAWQFVFAMDAKSVITAPSGEMRLSGPGPCRITGLAWSGRGKVTGVDVSVDGGATWQAARLNGTADPVCTVRFDRDWVWDGRPAILMSRCRDDTGAIQPTHAELVAARGTNAVYHYNGIMAWAINSDGMVGNAKA